MIIMDAITLKMRSFASRNPRWRAKPQSGQVPHKNLVEENQRKEGSEDPRDNHDCLPESPGSAHAANTVNPISN